MTAFYLAKLWFRWLFSGKFSKIRAIFSAITNLLFHSIKLSSLWVTNRGSITQQTNLRPHEIAEMSNMIFRGFER